MLREQLNKVPDPAGLVAAAWLRLLCGNSTALSVRPDSSIALRFKPAHQCSLMHIAPRIASSHHPSRHGHVGGGR
jgi:hypothetical protein